MRDEFELSRRKMLAGIGTVGAASAGAGMGTSAFFSDREEFRNNRLVAGELDMKMDWEEHYSDWSEDESAGLEYPVEMSDPEDSDYVGLPTPLDPLIWVHKDDLGVFMDNTAVEAFPDEDDDGLQDTIKSREQISSDGTLMTSEEVEEEFRAQFANVPDDFGSSTRTESSRGDPLIDLDDVKPGDFGEVTFSLHLFNNPGYIWVDTELIDADENGNTEPEAKDEDEIGPNEDDSKERNLFDTEGDEDDDGNTVQEPVELLDEIEVLLWHDNGDNLLGETELVEAPHDVDSDSSIELDRDEAIITGPLTLREFIRVAEDGGIPLDADTRDDERDCYPNSTTRYVCFAWWLPVDHANEIQGDSVGFDVGFYTEQCRHNDGTSRMEPEADSPTSSSVTITASDTTTDTTTSHRVEVAVGDDLDGDTLDELVVDYPSDSDFDISNVGEEDIVNSGVEDSDGNAVGADVTNVDGSDGGTTATFTYGSPLAGLSTGDTIFLEYEDVQNASTADTYTVDVSVNGLDVGSDTLEIS
jgi:predicted ribosomally synthesized peptide with SipW-like signal peptide